MKSKRFSPRARRSIHLLVGLALVASCGDASGPSNPRVPRVTSIAPSAITAGASGVTVQVSGSGFVERSVVRVGGVDAPTTFISPIRVDAQVPDSLLRAPGPVAVTVFTAAPGGGTSVAVTLERQNGAPSVARLLVDTVTSGTNVRTFTIIGDAFSAASIVEWNGVQQPTFFRRLDTLTFNAIGPVMENVGRFGIRVRNPAPGGLSADSAVVTVLDVIPSLDSFPIQGINSGLGSFEISLPGRNIRANTTLELNGVEYAAASWIANRIRVVVPAGALSAGPLQVRAVSPANDFQPTRYSEPRSLVVRAPSAPNVTSEVSVPIKARRMLWDPGADRLVVAVDSDGEEYAGTLSRFTTSGEFVDSLHLGISLLDVVRTDDAQFLYVTDQGYLGSGGVHRITLPGFQRDIFIPEPSSVHVRPLRGAPRSVLVLSGGAYDRSSTITIFDDATMRPSRNSVAAPHWTTYGRDPNVYVGGTGISGVDYYFRVGVQANGVGSTSRVVSPTTVRFPDSFGERIYHTKGVILEGDLEQVGTWDYEGPFVVDPVTGRVFVVTLTSIQVYDAWTAELIGSIVPSASLDSPGGFNHITRSIVRWGTDGLALLTPNALVILRSPLVAP